VARHYKIGEFAELAGVSRKTLRFYDDIGLLRPASVNSRTGYRGYEPRQLQELAEISSLKQLGLTLPEIRTAVANGRRDERRVLLERAKASLEISMADAAHALTKINSALSDLNDSAHPVAVVVRRVPAIRLASVRARVNSYRDVLPLEQELLSSLPEGSIDKLRGVFWHRCADSGVLEAEPFVQVRNLPQRRSFYDVRELPAITAACAYASDNEADSESAYEALKRWMSSCGNNLAGAKREIYRDGLLEIQFPLA
jgi:DNA-binding transcriptional MerR regulator